MIITLMKIKLGTLKKIIAEAKKKPAKKSNKITVTLDLDALKHFAIEQAEANGGSLETSGGVTPSELAQAWDGMSGLFTGTNKKFAHAIYQAFGVLEDAHRDDGVAGDELCPECGSDMWEVTGPAGAGHCQDCGYFIDND